MACERDVHQAFGDWHYMLAEMESMPESKWRQLVKGEKVDAPELEKATQLLHRAAGGFRAGAQHASERLKALSSNSRFERGYVELEAKGYEELSKKMVEMAKMLEKRQMPSLEYVHAIENMLTEQHRAIDLQTAAIGFLRSVSV